MGAIIYFVSGLGADERVFESLELPGFDCRHIRWVAPQRDESLGTYCSRLLAQIDRQKEVMLVGVSFGGIVCQELARLIDCKKVILISSIKSPDELPWPFRLAGRSRMISFLPARTLTLGSFLLGDYFFSIKSREQSLLLKQILQDTDPYFAIWAVSQLLTWRPSAHPLTLIHLHGTADRVFPIKHIHHPIPVQGGGHFMIVDKATEISTYLRELLN